MGRKGGKKQQQQEEQQVAENTIEQQQQQEVDESITAPMKPAPEEISDIPTTHSEGEEDESQDEQQQQQVVEAQVEAKKTPVKAAVAAEGDELSPGGESPQGKKSVPAKEVARTESKSPSANTNVAKKEQQQCPESPASTVENEPLLPSAATSERTSERTSEGAQSPAPLTAGTGNSGACSFLKQLVPISWQDFVEQPAVEFVYVLFLRVAVAIVALALRIFFAVQRTTIYSKVLGQVDATLAKHNTSLEQLKTIALCTGIVATTIDAYVVVPLKLKDAETTQGRIAAAVVSLATEVYHEAEAKCGVVVQAKTVSQ